MPHNRRMMIATKKTKSHAQALLGMAKDEEAKIADAVDAGDHRPSPRGIALGRSLPQEEEGSRTSDDPPPLDVERYPAPQVPLFLESSALRPRGPARTIRRNSSPAERSASRAPDGGWIFRRTDGRRPPDYQRSSSEGRGRTRSGSCADDAPRRGRGRPDACMRGRTNGGPCSRSRRGRGGQRLASRLDGKVREDHDDWDCVVGIGGIGHPHWSGCHVGEAR